ncbi:MAG TPA: GNAT family N-acetyltransferase [Candidatus Baltobacteraceae bacterium]|nr:GNAT family N-acetyltransferase [Candidatus Baltobacteraceae bacterium]
MNVERIDDLAGFEAERERWERLERLDPNATVFTSWRWLRAYFGRPRHRWFVLALRDGEETVAYLPLARGGSWLDRELYLGGNPTADYTGLLALPQHAERAVAAFADAILREPWDAFNVEDTLDPRMETLVQRLVQRGGVRIERTDETPCRSVALPPTWDRYITETISAKTRVNMVRVERRLAEALPNFRVSEPRAEDLDAHVEAMIAVNHDRWGGNIESGRRRYGSLFRAAFAQGVLRMFVYWDGARPIAGATAFVDELRSSFGLYMLGFDAEYEKFSPGKGIIGRAVRTAIEDGYARFDFLRGDEPFKVRYAPELHVTKHYRLLRPGLRAAAVAYARPKALALKLMLAKLRYGADRSL